MIMSLDESLSLKCHSCPHPKGYIMGLCTRYQIGQRLWEVPDTGGVGQRLWEVTSTGGVGHKLWEAPNTGVVRQWLWEVPDTGGGGGGDHR